MAPVRLRVNLILVALTALLALAAAKALYLAAVDGGKLHRVALSQQVTHVVVPALRGPIIDRTGLDLAVSEPADDISADPQLIRDPVGAAQKIAPILGVIQGSLAVKLADRTRGFVYLARTVPDATARQVAALRIAGITLAPSEKRDYPDGELAAQVLGTVGIDGQGLAGIEYARDAALHGTNGERRIVSDALGQSLSITDERAMQPGQPVQLTLDAAIQQRAEGVLASVGAAFTPLRATAIVMDPRDGSLLAVANWPRVDANNVAASPSWAHQDFATGFDYEPGSTFKVVAIGGALTDGLVTPQTPFFLPPQIQVADRTIHDAEARGSETLTVSQILAQSSNVGAIRIGLTLGGRRFDQWVRAYGFGTPTGVDLPGEERGLVLPFSSYSGSSMGNLPIGQGESVTPLQMATAYSMIANGGVLRPPHIVAAVGGHPTAEPAGHQVLSPTVAAELRKMLEGVLAPGGTASEISIPGYRLAGKTGTANKVDPLTGQYSSTQYVASFVGFAPAENPQVLVCVVVDQPQGAIYGTQVAAPAFGQIMSFALPYLKIPPG